MFAKVVMLADMGWNRSNGCVEKGGAKGQPGNVFENVGMFDSFFWRLSPSERGVAGDQDPGDGNRVETL